MALEQFKLYDDVNLTDEHQQGVEKKSFYTDGDSTVWFGATISGWECQANGGGNIVITPTNSVAEWQASTAYVLDDEVRTVARLGYYFKCTTAGTSGASEPTWSNAPNTNDTIVDGTVTWTNIGKLHEIDEIKLASTQAGLDAATGGAALTIAAPISSQTAYAIWMRYTDATGGGVAATNLSLQFNELEEYST